MKIKHGNMLALSLREDMMMKVKVSSTVISRAKQPIFASTYMYAWNLNLENLKNKRMNVKVFIFQWLYLDFGLKSWLPSRWEVSSSDWILSILHSLPTPSLDHSISPLSIISSDQWMKQKSRQPLNLWFVRERGSDVNIINGNWGKIPKLKWRFPIFSVFHKKSLVGGKVLKVRPINLAGPNQTPIGPIRKPPY